MSFYFIKFLLLFIIFWRLALPLSAQDVKAKAKAGESVGALLNRFKLPRTGESLIKFRQLNRLLSTQGLQRDRLYTLPIKRVRYNGQSIRSTLNISDFNQAQRIADFNEALRQAGIKTKTIAQDRDLWVPPAQVWQNASIPNRLGFVTLPVFGAKYQLIPIRDNKLKDCVYFIDAGHGGPDPGTSGTYNGHILREDEYAYDVSLRLARLLIQHGATVHLTVIDPDDGIRDAAVLERDAHETFNGGVRMADGYRDRLFQRTNFVNTTAEKYPNAKLQRFISIHIDAREASQNPQQIDVHFSYNPLSAIAESLGNKMLSLFRQKYAQYQPNRGYNGRLFQRPNLHVLKYTKPVALLVELGNISHPRDQIRFVNPENRQTLAEWLCEGLLLEVSGN